MQVNSKVSEVATVVEWEVDDVLRSIRLYEEPEGLDKIIFDNGVSTTTIDLSNEASLALFKILKHKIEGS